MSVEVDRLSKYYGSQAALDEISFQVGKGEIIGLLGPNGAGKSTTMKILTGYLKADGGKARICGIDVDLNSNELKKRIGYLPEHNPLYLDMYVREYLEFAGAIFGLKGQKLKKRMDELIDLTGLTAERKKKIQQLSKGYRQRVGLAQAMLHDPEVLILDEPTTGLDPNQIIEIRNLIAEVGKEKTVILSTHIMQEVKAICQRAVIISKGKIVADGLVSELASQTKGNKKLYLKFKQLDDFQWIKLIRGVKTIKSAAPNTLVAEIIEGLEIETQTEIFNGAAKRETVLLGIEWEESSLESVFQELTK